LHHIVGDAWSIGLLVRELGALYDACLAGRTDPLPPLAVQYVDYAVWQRRRLKGRTMADLLDRWRARLSDPPLRATLTADRPRASGVGRRGERLLRRLGRPTTEAARRLALEQRATLYMVLLSAFALLLKR